MSADAPSSHAAWQRVAPGTRLNNSYEIEQPIGAGGMGQVYRGREIATGKLVAIKMILPELERDEAALKLFLKEADALSDVNHDAVIRYYLFAEDSVLGRHFLALEFVDGRSLSDILRDGPLTFEAGVTLLQRLAAGLNTVHERGIVHRDIAPDNILIPSRNVERAKIIDFGIAKGSQHGTVIGSGFAGKYNYVSPEQLGLFGGNVTAKSDIYSLALVAADALTGQPLDMGGTPFDTIEKRRRVPDLSAIDTRIRPLLGKMLQPDPEDRIESMAAVTDWAASARGARRQRKSESREVPTIPRNRRGWRRAFAFLPLAVVIGAGAYYLDVRQVENPPPTDIRRFVEQYDGGKCFLFTKIMIIGNMLILEGVGASKKPFEDFSRAFQRNFGFEPDGPPVRTVTQRQCPAVEFLARLGARDPLAPRIDLNQDSLRNGEFLTGVIDHFGARSVDLLLVSDSGKVLNASLRANSSAKQINFKPFPTTAATAQTQLLIALAGTAPLPGLQSDNAEQVFPTLLTDAAQPGHSLSAAIKPFWLAR
jgi:serine/threonine-protein kinase